MLLKKVESLENLYLLMGGASETANHEIKNK